MLELCLSNGTSASYTWSAIFDVCTIKKEVEYSALNKNSDLIPWLRDCCRWSAVKTVRVKGSGWLQGKTFQTQQDKCKDEWILQSEKTPY